MDLKQTTIHLPPILHSEVRRQAEVRRMSMSEMTRRALIQYLDLKPRDLLKATLRFEARDEDFEWQSIWSLVDTETTTAYQVLHDLITLDVSAEKRADAVLAWVDPVNEQVSLQGERTTLVASACLAQPCRLADRLLRIIEKDLDSGRERIRHRVAHLLDRTGRPPIAEVLDLFSRHPENGMLLDYLSHLCRRNTAADSRQQLVASAEAGLSSQDHDVVMRALDLSASLRAGELIDPLADMSKSDSDVGYNALVALGAISARIHTSDGNVDGLFSADSPRSYRRVNIDRPLPVPSWQQWSVPEPLRDKALAALIRRAHGVLNDNRARATVINGIARSGLPEGLQCLKTLAQTGDAARPPAGPLVANALGQFDDEEARSALQQLANRGSTATRRAALKILHSLPPAAEEASAGPPTELFTLASLLRILAVECVQSPIHEMELNRRFSTLTPDHATARRWMVGLGLMNRENNEYSLSCMGEMISVVESWLEGHGVRGARRIELLRHGNGA